ncbi:MAG: DUF5818 domain-containing protein [Desulfoplanes sp.]|nr:DUF5818 domain-containing protein [Desulfoplanes sp.]MDD4649792.1 DUF5818 domain-containing protein [Desulfoplanes sp.]
MKKAFLHVLLLVAVFAMATPVFAAPVEITGLLQITDEGPSLNTEEVTYFLEGVDVSDLDGQQVVVVGEVREDNGKMIIDVVDVSPVEAENQPAEEENKP